MDLNRQLQNVQEQEEAETDIADIVRVHAVSPSVPRSYKVSGLLGDKQDSDNNGIGYRCVSEFGY